MTVHVYVLLRNKKTLHENITLHNVHMYMYFASAHNNDVKKYYQFP